MQIEIKDIQVLIGLICTPVKVKVRQKLMISICSFNILFNVNDQYFSNFQFYVLFWDNFTTIFFQNKQHNSESMYDIFYDAKCMIFFKIYFF